VAEDGDTLTKNLSNEDAVKLFEGELVELISSSNFEDLQIPSNETLHQMRAFLMGCLGKLDNTAMDFILLPCKDKQMRGRVVSISSYNHLYDIIIDINEGKVHGLVRKYFDSAVESESSMIDYQQFIRLIACHQYKKDSSKTKQSGLLSL
jgi:hypothetical protein